MENTKYLKIEDRFKRILETNYSDEEKILILHSDLVDVIRSSKELINDFKGMVLDHEWENDFEVLKDFEVKVNNNDRKYREMFNSFITISANSINVYEVYELMNESLNLYRRIIDYCFGKLSSKEKEESDNAYIHSGESPWLIGGWLRHPPMSEMWKRTEEHFTH